jgi:hypothetical protein
MKPADAATTKSDGKKRKRDNPPPLLQGRVNCRIWPLSIQSVAIPPKPWGSPVSHETWNSPVRPWETYNQTLGQREGRKVGRGPGRSHHGVNWSWDSNGRKEVHGSLGVSTMERYDVPGRVTGVAVGNGSEGRPAAALGFTMVEHSSMIACFLGHGPLLLNR